MKHAFFLGLHLYLLAACTSRTTTESAHSLTDSTGTNVPASGVDSGMAKTAALPQTTRLSSLSLSPAFDWKHVRLGDALTTAKAPEPDRPFEEDASHVGYSVEFDNLESVDYQYFTKDTKVAGIRVDLYLNNPGSVQAYQQDLIAYYTARYGTAQANAGVYRWTSGPVTLKNVSKAKEYGLVVKIGNVPAAR